MKLGGPSKGAGAGLCNDLPPPATGGAHRWYRRLCPGAIVRAAFPVDHGLIRDVSLTAN